jgi:NAD(P)-dependent dehydrogenase (short-subunit alcohol dehydrogenase family)
MGYNVAQQLALKGAKVYVSARSLEKADNAIKQMKEDHPSLAREDLLRPLALELGDLQNINAVAAKFAAEEKRLDVLVNNAALLARPLDLDKNGISVSFATKLSVLTKVKGAQSH